MKINCSRIFDRKKIGVLIGKTWGIYFFSFGIVRFAFQIFRFLWKVVLTGPLHPHSTDTTETLRSIFSLFNKFFAFSSNFLDFERILPPLGAKNFRQFCRNCTTRVQRKLFVWKLFFLKKDSKFYKSSRKFSV